MRWNDLWKPPDSKTVKIKPKRRKRRRLQADRKTFKKVKKLFFQTKEWKELRYRVLVRDGGRCQCCGRSAKDGVVMNVDHIKPRHKHPELAMDIDNLQTLCSCCNRGKNAWDTTDWRDEHGQQLDAEYQAIMGHP